MIRKLLRRNRLDDERAQEMRVHIEHFVDDLVAAGRTPDEARREAMREFGNPTLIREFLYEMNSIRTVEAIGRDARYALRLLRRTPAFTAAAVLTLAVAIGVNTAVFSVADAFLLRPLPYPDSQRLGLVSARWGGDGPASDDTAQTGTTWQLVHENATTVTSAAFSNWTTGVNVVANGRASYLTQQRVSAGFFDVLGVQPLIGRGFSDAEDRPGGPLAVILSHTAWTTEFRADPAAMGSVISVRGEPATVVGVMPAGFATEVPADLWMPLRPTTTGEGAGENYTILLRLKNAATWQEASAEVATLTQPVLEQQRDQPRRPVRFSTVSWQRTFATDLREPILLLWAAVAVVLVVACVNLAGLLLARAAGRRHELATRMALGSGRSGVIRQLVVESVVLAMIGGAAGIVIGIGALDALQRLATDAFRIARPVTLDARAMAVAMTLSLIGSLLFGIVPALHASRIDIQRGLAPSSARTVTRGGHWSRRGIVLAQVTLSVMLLTGAGLLVRTFVYLNNLHPGFEPRGLTAASFSLQDARYDSPEEVTSLIDRMLERIRTIPGIERATLSLGVPYQRLLNLGFRRLDGARSTGRTSATYISDGYLDTMRIPLRSGRTFDVRDSALAPGVVIVNETFVKTYYNGEEPLGRRIAVAGREREIVGVTGDVQLKPGWGTNGPLAPMPLSYVPVSQVSEGMLRLVHGWFSPTLIVRSSAGDTASAIRNAVAAVDPLLPLAEVRTMDDVRAASIAAQRFLMTILVALALTTVLLAAVGLHGLIATTVTERTREMGIRLALGATPKHAVRSLAAPGVLLAIAGTVAGILLARAGAGLLRHYLWGVSADDPATHGAVAALLIAIASGASVLPALRILRLDPAQTLRME